MAAALAIRTVTIFFFVIGLTSYILISLLLLNLCDQPLSLLTLPHYPYLLGLWLLLPDNALSPEPLAPLALILFFLFINKYLLKLYINLDSRGLSSSA